MRYHETWIEPAKKESSYHLALDTERWTSSAYQITFDQIALIDSQENPDASFRLSAWGISTSLRQLLADYSDQDIRKAVDWLTIQQNAYVALMLEDAMLNVEQRIDLPMLDQIFISIDAELYLPRGLRMIVTCITNIVQVDENNHELDKFVAVVDPGEAHVYAIERRGISMINANTHKH